MDRPVKLARQSLSQKDVKSPPSGEEEEESQQQEQEEDPFHGIGKDLHRQVLSYLLCLEGERSYERYLASKQLPGTCRDLSLVSSAWRNVTGDVMNLQAPREIISPRGLAELKAAAFRIDLSSVCVNFIRDMQERWGGDQLSSFEAAWPGVEVDETDPLDIIVERFGGTYSAFAKIVAMEYTKFLLVKCVEHLAKTKAATTTVLNTWNEKCVPNKLVDMFWHAHMLAPKKYATDCTMLIGDIIDHDAGYVSADAHNGSDYASKKACLFQFEQQFAAKDYFGGRLDVDGAMMLFDQDFNVMNVARHVWEDMNGFNDCG